MSNKQFHLFCYRAGRDPRWLGDRLFSELRKQFALHVPSSSLDPEGASENCKNQLKKVELESKICLVEAKIDRIPHEKGLGTLQSRYQRVLLKSLHFVIRPRIS